MESGTAPKVSEAVNGAASNGAGSERIEVINPATGETIGTVAVDSPERVAEAVARVRANQAEWEALGIAGRTAGSGGCATGCSTTPSACSTRCRLETGKVRGDAMAEIAYLDRPDQLLRAPSAAKFIGDEAVRAHSPLAASKKLRVQYRPIRWSA